MKLSKTFPLLGLSVSGLAGSSAAGSLLDTIVAAIQQSDRDTVALNAAYLAFTGDIGPASAAAGTLVANVVKGRQQINATPGADLVTDDVLTLSASVSALYTDSKTLVATLTAAKPALEAGGFCVTVQKETAEISSASNALIDDITRRVNPADRPAAGAVSGLITEQLAKAEALFKDCKDTGPPKSTSTATPSASAPGTTSTGGVTTSTGTLTGTTSSTGTGTKTGSTTETSSTGASSTGKSSTANSSTGTASSGTGVTTVTGTGTGTGIATPCTSTTGIITSSRWSNSTTRSAPSVSVTVTTICTTTTATTTSGSGCKTCPSGGNGNGGNGNGGNGNGNGNGNGGNGNGGSGGNGNAPPTTNSGNLMAPAGALALAIAALVL